MLFRSDEIDPSKTATLTEFQKYFIKKAGRHHASQQDLKDAGICSNVAGLAELAPARAELAETNRYASRRRG